MFFVLMFSLKFKPQNIRKKKKNDNPNFILIHFLIRCIDTYIYVYELLFLGFNYFILNYNI